MKLLIVDGNSIMNRAFYGVRPLVTRTGIHTNAIYGYLNILKKHLDGVKPDLAAVAFDLKAPTFRHKMFDAYKAGRHKTPDELLSQVDYIKEATRLLGIKTVSLEGFEADDILGTLSNKFEGESFIVTGDRDSFQLVSEKTTVILSSNSGDELYTPEKIEEKYQLPPKKLIEVKALAGDSSDNIPGVPGIGEKTAIKLVLEGGSVDGIYEKLESGELSVTDSVKKKLEEGRDSALLSRKLAEIALEVEGIPEFEELKIGTEDKNALRELFVKLEFTKLMERFGLTEEKKEKKENQIDLFSDQISFDTAADEETEIEALPENEFLPLLKGDIIPLDFIGDTCYFDADGRIISSKVTSSLISSLADKRLALFDSKEFWHLTGDSFDSLSPDVAAFDIQLASYVDNPDSKGDFSRIVMTYLGKSVPLGAESRPEWRVPLIKPLFDQLKSRMEELRDLYYGIELPLARVLAGMEREGFGVDSEGIAEYGKELHEKMSATEKSIFAIAGEEFNINSPKQLGQILFEKMSLPVIKKKKTGYSTDAETLEKLRFYSPIIDFILEYRRLAKLYGTYIEGLLKVVEGDGRIRTSFNQKQTLTGRLSSSEPNLQNIPIRTPEGSELRRFFVAKEGYTLIDADYSQIELRVLAHMSGDENLISAFNSGTDIHSATASQVFGVPIDSVTPELRSRAKAVNFGIVYGMGAFSLSDDLKVSMKEASAYIESYFATYPKVKEYLDSCVKGAYDKGYTETLWGRRRYIPELSVMNKQLRAFGERVAKNSPIQGTAADVIKLAMVKTDRRLRQENLESRLILQVHDELIIEAKNSEKDYVARLLKEEMEGVAELAVTLAVDVGDGENWLSAKK